MKQEIENNEVKSQDQQAAANDIVDVQVGNEETPHEVAIENNSTEQLENYNKEEPNNAEEEPKTFKQKLKSRVPGGIAWLLVGGLSIAALATMIFLILK